MGAPPEQPTPDVPPEDRAQEVAAGEEPEELQCYDCRGDPADVPPPEQEQPWPGRNTFLCGGYLMTGPEPLTLLGTTGLIVCPVAIFLLELWSKSDRLDVSFHLIGAACYAFFALHHLSWLLERRRLFV
eukprot:TRINITY_DN35599_c0_g2_i1.p1 TRINITY_DN35599_c0_g2~~TRINITY_DN35599_c0_g2_i1.p1  ORF type:complete len:129 (-),score=17.22 TRINITY_DN35599_c0_g2_i1:165-551(-)